MIRNLIVALTLITIFDTSAKANGHPKDIIDIAVAAGIFNTLVAASKAAGLLETLKGDGPFTLFAPTDDVFGALPAGTVEDLLKSENKSQLINILTYHGLAGKVMPSDISGKAMEVEMLNKAMAKIDATTGVKINGANVIKGDIKATNGVIHVIDAVILP